MNNTALVDAYSELHRRLGERSFWIYKLEDEINQILSRMSRAVVSGEDLRDLRGHFVSKKDLLFTHKNAAYDAILWIYQIEAEMDKRTVGEA